MVFARVQGPGDVELVFNGTGFQFCNMKSILEVKVQRVAQQHAKRHIKVFKSLTEQMPIPMGVSSQECSPDKSHRSNRSEAQGL